jgi:DNA-binding response OmpR family regulator
VTLRRPLLLIVDDDRRTAALLAELLCDDGYDTEVAPDGTAALARFEHEPIPDALITDYHVPDADGLTIARRARACRSAMPIFVVTGDPESVTHLMHERATEIATERATERATEIATERATERAIERATERAIEVMSKPLDYASLVARLRAVVPASA